MSKTALILLAHGARDPEWSAPMRRVWLAIQAQRPGQRIGLAFLEFIKPDLPESVAMLRAEGIDRIIIVPLFLAQGGHLKKGVPLLIDEFRRQHPQVSFELTAPVGEADEVIRAMTAHILSITDE